MIFAASCSIVDPLFALIFFCTTYFVDRITIINAMTDRMANRDIIIIPDALCKPFPRFIPLFINLMPCTVTVMSSIKKNRAKRDIPIQILILSGTCILSSFDIEFPYPLNMEYQIVEKNQFDRKQKDRLCIDGLFADNMESYRIVILFDPVLFPGLMSACMHSSRSAQHGSLHRCVLHLSAISSLFAFFLLLHHIPTPGLSCNDISVHLRSCGTRKPILF